MAFAGNAVVLGASMAGLITARVLSETYDTVTIIDRDTLPEAVAARSGVPSPANCTCCWQGAGAPSTSSSRA